MASSVLDVPAIENVLLSVHQMLAAITAEQELQLSPGEAKALAEGLANVARHYDFLAGASQKWVDITNLVIICGGIYGAKIYNMSHRRPYQPPPENNVVPFRPNTTARQLTPEEPPAGPPVPAQQALNAMYDGAVEISTGDDFSPMG